MRSARQKNWYRIVVVSHGRCQALRWEFVKNRIINSSQEFKKCSVKGRDCIEEMSNATFNCQTPCEGIYADITQWDDVYTMETTENVMQPVIAEYKTFKKNNVRHFKFNSSAATTVYGR